MLFGAKKVFICRDNTRNKIKELNSCQKQILYKSSRGAVEFVDWEYKTSCIDVLLDLKSKNINIVGVEITNFSEFIHQTELSFPLALVLMLKSRVYQKK